MSFGQLMGGKAWLERVPEAAMKQTGSTKVPFKELCYKVARVALYFICLHRASRGLAQSPRAGVSLQFEDVSEGV